MLLRWFSNWISDPEITLASNILLHANLGPHPVICDSRTEP